MVSFKEIKEELELLKLHIRRGDLHLATWSVEELEKMIDKLKKLCKCKEADSNG